VIVSHTKKLQAAELQTELGSSNENSLDQNSSRGNHSFALG